VATVFVLTAFNLADQPMNEAPHRLTALPIRIGRNALNDYVVNHGAISSFHARIEDVDGKLCIIDLGSKNGVRVPLPGAIPVMVPPNQPMDLAPAGFQFFLGSHVRIQITFDQVRDLLEFRGPLSMSGEVLGNAHMLLQTPSQLPAPPAMPAQGPHGGPGLGGVSPLPALAGAPSPGPAAGAPPPLHAAGQPQPGGPRQRANTGFLGPMNAEVMALQGLRELAGSLIPGVPLESTGDIARFITKLHDALDVFCRSFIPLRDGYSQFISSLDLQRSSVRRSHMRSPSYLAVEGATTPEAVALALLSPSDRSFDAPQAVEGIFADLMLHQLAMLEGVMRGVRALLEELSPENIERNAGGHLPLGRYKAIWTTYCQTFENLYEERQAFAYIFGPEFTAAYRQYRAGRPDEAGRG
jgi:type VI secretion system protein ImpI